MQLNSNPQWDASFQALPCDASNVVFTCPCGGPVAVITPYDTAPAATSVSASDGACELRQGIRRASAEGSCLRIYTGMGNLMGEMPWPHVGLIKAKWANHSCFVAVVSSGVVRTFNVGSPSSSSPGDPPSSTPLASPSALPPPIKSCVRRRFFFSFLATPAAKEAEQDCLRERQRPQTRPREGRPGQKSERGRAAEAGATSGKRSGEQSPAGLGLSGLTASLTSGLGLSYSLDFASTSFASIHQQIRPDHSQQNLTQQKQDQSQTQVPSQIQIQSQSQSQNESLGFSARPELPASSPFDPRRSAFVEQGHVVVDADVTSFGIAVVTNLGAVLFNRGLREPRVDYCGLFPGARSVRILYRSTPSSKQPSQCVLIVHSDASLAVSTAINLEGRVDGPRPSFVPVSFRLSRRSVTCDPHLRHVELSETQRSLCVVLEEGFLALASTDPIFTTLLTTPSSHLSQSLHTKTITLDVEIVSAPALLAKQIGWMGDEAVAMSVWTPTTSCHKQHCLFLSGHDQKWVDFLSPTPLFVQQEIDGLRIFGANSISFLHAVSPAMQTLLSPESCAPSAILLFALRKAASVRPVNQNRRALVHSSNAHLAYADNAVSVNFRVPSDARFDGACDTTVADTSTESLEDEFWDHRNDENDSTDGSSWDEDAEEDDFSGECSQGFGGDFGENDGEEDYRKSEEEYGDRGRDGQDEDNDQDGAVKRLQRQFRTAIQREKVRHSDLLELLPFSYRQKWNAERALEQQLGNEGDQLLSDAQFEKYVFDLDPSEKLAAFHQLLGSLSYETNFELAELMITLMRKLSATLCTATVDTIDPRTKSGSKSKFEFPEIRWGNDSAKGVTLRMLRDFRALQILRDSGLGMVLTLSQFRSLKLGSLVTFVADQDLPSEAVALLDCYRLLPTTTVGVLDRDWRFAHHSLREQLLLQYVSELVSRSDEKVAVVTAKQKHSGAAFRIVPLPLDLKACIETESRTVLREAIARAIETQKGDLARSLTWWERDAYVRAFAFHMAKDTPSLVRNFRNSPGLIDFHLFHRLYPHRDAQQLILLNSDSAKEREAAGKERSSRKVPTSRERKGEGGAGGGEAQEGTDDVQFRLHLAEKDARFIASRIFQLPLPSWIEGEGDGDQEGGEPEADGFRNRSRTRQTRLSENLDGSADFNPTEGSTKASLLFQTKALGNIGAYHQAFWTFFYTMVLEAYGALYFGQSGSKLDGDSPEEPFHDGLTHGVSSANLLYPGGSQSKGPELSSRSIVSLMSAPLSSLTSAVLNPSSLSTSSGSASQTFPAKRREIWLQFLRQMRLLSSPQTPPQPPYASSQYPSPHFPPSQASPASRAPMARSSILQEAMELLSFQSTILGSCRRSTGFSGFLPQSSAQWAKKQAKAVEQIAWEGLTVDETGEALLEHSGELENGTALVNDFVKRFAIDQKQLLLWKLKMTARRRQWTVFHECLQPALLAAFQQCTPRLQNLVGSVQTHLTSAIQRSAGLVGLASATLDPSIEAAANGIAGRNGSGSNLGSESSSGHGPNFSASNTTITSGFISAGGGRAGASSGGGGNNSGSGSGPQQSSGQSSCLNQASAQSIITDENLNKFLLSMKETYAPKLPAQAGLAQTLMNAVQATRASYSSENFTPLLPHPLSVPPRSNKGPILPDLLPAALYAKIAVQDFMAVANGHGRDDYAMALLPFLNNPLAREKWGLHLGFQSASEVDHFCQDALRAAANSPGANIGRIMTRISSALDASQQRLGPR